MTRKTHSTDVAAADCGQGAHMWVSPRYRDPMQEAGLSSVDDVMTSDAGRLLRSLPDRENWRLELHDAHRGSRAAYLKKHHTRTWRNWLRAKFQLGPGASAGRVEASNVARLKLDGIRAMRLIAYGDRLHADGLLESFVITEELAGFTQLDHFLRRRFPERDGRSKPDPELSRLIRAVADVAARFHHSGYNHRDLYCCHFFIREPSPGEFQVHLIDLQRVEHRRRFRRRWVVKDLAQLAYSAPTDRVSCTQRMAFIKHYLGVRKLRPRDKRLIRRVLAKQQLMQRDLGAHP
jgi:heptose I phosphotransferase